MKKLLLIALLCIPFLACGGSVKATGDGDEDATDAPGDTTGDGNLDAPADTPGADTGGGDTTGDTGGGDTAGDTGGGDTAGDTGGDTAGDTTTDGECTDWYHDGDSDGYGDPTDTVCRETCPEGYVGNDDDCCDSIADVNPAQTSFFDTAYSCGGLTDSFDYNCDGTEEQRWTTMGSCSTGSDGSCVGTEGWHGSTPPDCGVNHYWMGTCSRSSGGTGCTAPSTMRVQECR
jgi:hypothetical protein